MGIRKSLMGLGQKAVDQLMADEGRAKAVASALGSVQRGRKALEERQEDVMRALHFATTADFKAISKKLAGLKRRTRELDQKLGQYTGRRARPH